MLNVADVPLPEQAPAEVVVESRCMP